MRKILRLTKVLWFLLVIMALDFSAVSQANTEKWQSVRDESLVIKEGNPLDFSKWVLPGPAGKYGRVIASKGKLRFEDASVTPNFTCASLAWSRSTGGFPNHNDADAYAIQLKRHGYNLVRFHFVETLLMSGRDHDFDFDPQQLDNWLYFLYALKREGIYWVMDGMTSPNGAFGGIYPHRYIKKYDLKTDIYLDAKAQEHWRELISRVFTIKNPYTKVRIIDDPALIGVVLVNEGGINYLANSSSNTSRKWPTVWQIPFNVWLQEKYKNTADLKKAWRTELNSGELLLQQNILLPKTLREHSLRMADFQQFIAHLEISTYVWMSDYIRSLGFKGLLTQYDNMALLGADVSRATLPWIDMHSYHDAEGAAFLPGAKLKQTSAISDMGSYLRDLAASRQKDKPFSVTEYGQPFWNRYRFEAGPMAAAMASLQDWDFICVHAHGVIDLSLKQDVPFKRAIQPYAIGIDPTARASETLATLMRLRGDIRPAPHEVNLDFTGASLYDGSGINEASDDLTALSWLTKVNKKVTPADDLLQSNQAIRIEPLKISSFFGVFNKIKFIQWEQLNKNIQKLQNLKIISNKNNTDLLQGVLHSETGEVTLDKKRLLFKINTNKTEAVSSALTNWHENINILSVKNMDVEGLVAISSLDNHGLNQSKRILIIRATDSQNTGMKFADKNRQELVVLGKMPPQIKMGKAELFLKLDVNKNYSLHSLHLNGDYNKPLNFVKNKNGLTIVLNDFYSKSDPTTFYVLEIN